MRHEQHWLKQQGSLLLIFFPYSSGLFLSRVFLWGQELRYGVLFPAALLLLLLAGTSAYGFLLSAAAFFLFGICASDSFAHLSFLTLLSGINLLDFLGMALWFPVLFAAGYLGLLNTGCLLQAHGFGTEGRLKTCLYTNAIQCGMIVCTALISHMIKM